MHLYTYICRIHIDEIIKTSEDFFKKIYLSLYLKGFECERELETEQRLQHIDLPSPSRHRRVSFSSSWAAQPGAWGLSLSGTCSHSSIFSPTGLVSKLTRGSQRPLLPGAGFLYRLLSLTRLVSKLTDILSSPSYIIVQSPTQYLPITGHRDESLLLSLEWHV